MLGLDQLAMKKNYPLVKQRQSRYRSKLLPQIDAKVDKLIAAGFIREVKYLIWVSSIVP
jgi:tRNA A37 N6-isopentenylltransferase MiaA